MRSQAGSAVCLVALLAVAGPAPHAQSVATVPVSPHSVTLRTSTPDGRSASLKVLNGGLARLSIDGGPTLGITPLLKDDALQVIFFEVLTKPTGEAYGLRHLDKLTLGPGAPQRYAWKTLVVDLSWEGVEAVSEEQFRRCVAVAEAAGGAQVPGGAPDGPCLSCCVACDGVSVCGCAVVTDCGSCCCPDACACG